MAAPFPVVLVAERLPPRLFDLPRAPAALFVRGEIPRGPAVAIVGTRRPTPEAVRFTKKLAKDLARMGVAILSGGARGIDTAAHRGALAGRGVTVVVAPAGYARAYPPENATLFARILQSKGVYASLVPDDEAATRAGFFARNAAMVALAHVVVVVQAGFRSGARNAAAQARRLGRPLLVVPSAPWIARGQGCLLELRQGARLCEGPADVLAALEQAGSLPFSLNREGVRLASTQRPADSAVAKEPSDGTARIHEFSSNSEESELERRLVEWVLGGATHVDELVVQAGLSVAVVNRVLLTLRLRGVLVSDSSGRLAVPNSLD